MKRGIWSNWVGVLALIAIVVATATLFSGNDAMAQVAASEGYHVSPNAGTGQPVDRQITMQNPVTHVANEINRFHRMVNIIIIAIAAFVLLLLLYVMMNFSERRNPTPSRTTHNTFLEVAWTVIPILILVVIAVPSFRLLFLQYSFPKPDMTIKAVGNAWFWEHQYPDVKDRGGRPLNITSNMITDTDLVKTEIGDAEFDRRYGKLPELQKLKAVQEAAVPLWAGTSAKVKAKYGDRLVRQLSVDNEIAVPVGKTIHLLITSNDVIHSWTIPSFGSKMQAVPGRVTATWFKPDKIGVYYGQCSVLCGKLHSGMPIAVRVVSDKAYGDWIAALQAGDRNRARTILQTATAPVEPKTLAALSN